MANANALVAQLDQNEAEYRVAPHNLDAEQALLGAIIVNNEAYYRVSDFLEPEHFYEDLHRRIFEVTSSLIKAGKVATPITLKTFLGRSGSGRHHRIANIWRGWRPKRRRSSTLSITARRSMISRSAAS